MLLVHLVGIGKTVGQVANQRPRHRVGLAKLALHGLGVDHIYHGVGGCHRAGVAFPLAHDRGQFAEQLAGLQCSQRQPFVRLDVHRSRIDQIEIVALLAHIEDHFASLEGLANHNHDKLHNLPSW